MQCHISVLSLTPPAWFTVTSLVKGLGGVLCAAHIRTESWHGAPPLSHGKAVTDVPMQPFLRMATFSQPQLKKSFPNSTSHSKIKNSDAKKQSESSFVLLQIGSSLSHRGPPEVSAFLGRSNPCTANCQDPAASSCSHPALAAYIQVDNLLPLQQTRSGTGKCSRSEQQDFILSVRVNL